MQPLEGLKPMPNRARTALRLFMSLLFAFLTITSVGVIAQPQPSGLTNTSWLVTAKDYYEAAAGTSAVVTIYYFGTDGKATVYLTFVYAPPPQITYDPLLGWRTIYHDPETKTLKDSNGTYKQMGRSVVIKFSDHVVQATINDN